jgi:hypothetical protein
VSVDAGARSPAPAAVATAWVVKLQPKPEDRGVPPVSFATGPPFTVAVLYGDDGSRSRTGREWRRFE